MTSRISALATRFDERWLVGLTWPLLLIMALMLTLSLASVSIVSTLRAYAHCHAHWGIAEHEAVYQLRRYADSGDQADYQRFQQAIAVPLASRTARLQMQSERPDLQVLTEALVAGGVAPEDVRGIVRVFRLFKAHPLMIRAVAAWRAGDALVVEMARTGEQLHAELAPDHAPDVQRVRALVARADELHAHIAPHLTTFGDILGAASRQITLLLLVVLPVTALLLVLGGIAISRRLARRTQRMGQKLQTLAERLAFQAAHDALTGLPNRAEFEARLEEAIAEQRRTHAATALLYFDLDQLKVVNDTCGHAAGDELIRQVAWTLRKQLLREEDTIARLGGDEFGVLLPGCAIEDAVAVSEQIRARIDELRFFWQERAFSTSASIGVVALGESLPNVAAVLSAADQACYVAKANGRNRVQRYSPNDEQLQSLQGEMNWVERLHWALDHDGFTLFAQEILPVAAAAKTARGEPAPRKVELLLRMRMPDGQIVAPMAFIPAAERYGLMPRIDRWVIARACRELASLRARGATLPVCMINLSGTSVSDPSLADHVAACLHESGLPGAHIGVELTETAAVGNLASCSQLMVRLSELGCPIALDDFGTGMSSFSYLRNLPIDFLKIDRAFIRNIGGDPIDFALVETIQRIGGIMGVRTVAEGVESEEVLAALSIIGVDFAQGFHFSQPMPLEHVAGPAAEQQPYVLRRRKLT